MRSLFEAIQWLFVDVLYLPFDWLRALELETWFGANLLNWIFMAICCYYTWYWIKQIGITKDEDVQDTTAHSFLG
ncbi:DUF6341 family protein [Flavobacterium selenitireducens]|uniref:DUF6341 family protein n=1 Tax=Flavobacterium selenitireducens TaxID=2722704 RepID=UPI00168B0965|nr:uracil phosphoribosyltransferase [Flavobacterium selenitireducens]MBD3581600.1 uracil phosphoribosyltransferase [Flavobacterium selenitireducens]